METETIAKTMISGYIEHDGNGLLVTTEINHFWERGDEVLLSAVLPKRRGQHDRVKVRACKLLPFEYNVPDIGLEITNDGNRVASVRAIIVSIDARRCRVRSVRTVADKNPPPDPCNDPFVDPIYWWGCCVLGIGC